MGGICRYCAGDYWECGEGALCSDTAAVETDHTHDLLVIGRVFRGCLQAKLWVPDVSLPPGWEEWNSVPIRVQTFRAGQDPMARVWVPKPEDVGKKCPGVTEGLQEYTLSAEDVDVHIAVRRRPPAMPYEQASASDEDDTHS
jgi:hypothetical protein